MEEDVLFEGIIAAEKKMAPKKSLSFLSALLATSLLFSSCTARESLYSGQRLSSGQSLGQGRYVLTMQPDCNLVLYTSTPTSATAIWSSGTFRRGVGCFALLTANGVLGVYNGAGVRLWASGPNLAVGNYILNLQPDRNLVIYGPARWGSGTRIATAGFSQFAVNATVNNP